MYTQKTIISSFPPSKSSQRAAEDAFKALQNNPSLLKQRIIKSVSTTIDASADYWTSLNYLYDNSNGKGEYVRCQVYFAANQAVSCGAN